MKICFGSAEAAAFFRRLAASSFRLLSPALWSFSEVGSRGGLFRRFAISPFRLLSPSLALFSLLLPSLAFLAPLSHAGAGKTGGQFLRVVQSPRAAGMGEAGTALYGDLPGSLSLNPASLGMVFHREAAFTYSSWVEDISMQHFAYAHPTEKSGVLAVSGAMLQVKPFPGYDNTGGYTEDVKATDSNFSAAYARRISGPWYDKRSGVFIGAAAKYASEKIENASASTVLFDAGLLALRPAGSGTLGFGLSAQSLGSGYKFDSERDPAPAVYRGGVSYMATVFGDPLAVAADIKKPSDDNLAFSLGAEFVLKRILAWRVGFISGQDAGSGMRFGMGFNLKLFRLDYSLASFGKFGLAHRVGISVKFGEPVEITPHITPEQEKARWRTDRAKQLMRENRHYEAVLELNEALKLDPYLKEAVELMKKARNFMETEK